MKHVVTFDVSKGKSVMSMYDGYKRISKKEKSDAHELAKTHFKMERDYTYQQDEYYEQIRALT